MILTLHNELDLDLDQIVLYQIMGRMAYHITQATTIDIYPQAREKSGFMEWISVIRYYGGGSLTIGCVQRTPNSPVEFHS